MCDVQLVFTLCITEKDIHSYYSSKKTSECLRLCTALKQSRHFLLDRRTQTKSSLYCKLEQTLQWYDMFLLFFGIGSFCYFCNVHLCPLFLPLFPSHRLSCLALSISEGKNCSITVAISLWDDGKQLLTTPFLFHHQPEEGGQVDCEHLGLWCNWFSWFNRLSLGLSRLQQYARMERETTSSLFFFCFFSSITTPQVERKWWLDSSGNCIPRANYWVYMSGQFVLPITDSVYVAVTTLGNVESDLGALSSSYQKV